MNKFFIAVTGSAAMLAMISGCYYTQIVSPESSPEMQEWERVILESYPGYTPPKTTSKTYRGQAEKRYSSTPAKLVPMDDPAKNDTPVTPVTPAEPEVIKIEEPANTPEAEEKVVTPAVEEIKAEEPAEVEEKKTEEPAKVEEKKTEEPAKVEEKKTEEPAKVEEKKTEEPAKVEEKKTEEPAKVEEKKADDGAMPPDPTNSTVYEVKPGDTLSGISHKVYGNAGFSNVIFRANADILKDPNKLRPGMKLIIPNL